MNLRGRYESGGVEVTARRWWSPRDRKAARTAAKLWGHMAAERRRAFASVVAERIWRGEL